MTNTIPVVDYLQLGDDSYLVAHECENCAALYFDRRNACANCFERAFSPKRLSNQGVLRAFTVVQRGAKSGPYVSAVVELDGGGVVKANLIGVLDPEMILPGMRLRLITFDAGVDDDGTVAVAFGFEPIGAVND